MTATLPAHPYVRDLPAPEKCGICGTGFLRNEIPFRGLVSDEPFHAACYRSHYEAMEHDPIECIQWRHREP